MKKKFKISSTAYRVLLLMRLLTENEQGFEDLNTFFYLDPYISRNFSKEVIVKYINTLKLAGYTFSKPSQNNNKYKLLKAPVSLKCTNEDLKTLAIIEEYVSSLYQMKLQKNFAVLMDKISRYLSEEQYATLSQYRKVLKTTPYFDGSRYAKYAKIIREIEQYCIENQRVVIKYILPLNENEMQILFEPKSIQYSGNAIYISGINPLTSEKQLLHVDYIKDIKQTPLKSKLNHVLSPVVFILKGRLAKGYRPYEGEKIIETNTDIGTIKVTTYTEDKNLLIQRLMRYGEFCEIVYPKSILAKIKKHIQDTLKNYESN